jgi:phytoene synthase
MMARACDLGLAMQLTNIARDVGEDAANGRLYLPADWLRREGVDPAAFLRDPRPLPGVRRVVLQLLEVADGLYTMADAGLARLPASVRPSMIAARLVYADIGRVIRRAGGDSVTSRAVVSASRKAALLAKALLASFAPAGSLLHEPPTPETAFLVEAIAAAGDRA